MVQNFALNLTCRKTQNSSTLKTAHMNIQTRFIIIDDDALNNKICSVTIRKIDSNAHIDTFTDPVEGFAYVSTLATEGHDANVILFLDINMPMMDGWEFLKQFDALEEIRRKRIRIYILSSSVEKTDMDRAKNDRNVSQYLIKPLTKETITLITKFENNPTIKH